MKSSMWIFSLMTVVALTQGAWAGDKEGNGGGDCDDLVQFIRGKMTPWIQSEGPSKLNFSDVKDTNGNPVTLVEYQTKMSALLPSDKTAISCTSNPVTIERLGLSADKVCENYMDNGKPNIVCNSDEFMKIPSDHQYRLVHHEFAGLAGFEANTNVNSVYPISDQIAGFVTYEVVPVLSINPVVPAAAVVSGVNPSGCDVSYRATDVRTIAQKILQEDLGKAVMSHLSALGASLLAPLSPLGLTADSDVPGVGFILSPFTNAVSLSNGTLIAIYFEVEGGASPIYLDTGDVKPFVQYDRFGNITYYECDYGFGLRKGFVEPDKIWVNISNAKTNVTIDKFVLPITSQKIVLEKSGKKTP